MNIPDAWSYEVGDIVERISYPDVFTKIGDQQTVFQVLPDGICYLDTNGYQQYWANTNIRKVTNPMSYWIIKSDINSMKIAAALRDAGITAVISTRYSDSGGIPAIPNIMWISEVANEYVIKQL